MRFYEPNTGRFTQLDPIRDGINWYAYAGGNPMGYVDPWGLAWYDGWLSGEWGSKIPILGGLYENAGTAYGFWESGNCSGWEALKWGGAAAGGTIVAGVGIYYAAPYIGRTILGTGRNLAAIGAYSYGAIRSIGQAFSQGLNGINGGIMLGFSEDIQATLSRGINYGYLNVPTWTWTANRAFLYGAKISNKYIHYATSPNTAINTGRIYEKEIEYLTKQGILIP